MSARSADVGLDVDSSGGAVDAFLNSDHDGDLVVVGEADPGRTFGSGAAAGATTAGVGAADATDVEGVVAESADAAAAAAEPGVPVEPQYVVRRTRGAPRSLGRRIAAAARTTQVAEEPAGVLIDTDVFIDHLRGARRLSPPEGRGCYSVLTRGELFAGRKVDEDVVRTLLGPFSELGVDREIAERAGRIRRETGLHLADAVIAATAIEHGLAVRTRNIADFGRVPGLVVEAGGEWGTGDARP